jgi:hypothetical protein
MSVLSKMVAMLSAPLLVLFALVFAGAWDKLQTVGT